MATATFTSHTENATNFVDADIPIGEIQVPDIQMREVNRETDHFKGLVHDIKQRGLLQRIAVMPIEDREGKYKYRLVFGFHRIAALEVLNYKVIPATIQPQLDEDEVRFLQVSENLQRLESRPSELAKQLQRIIRVKKWTGSTLPEILQELNIKKSQQWAHQYLKLNRLNQDLKELVDQGHIKLTNAIELAQLPADTQEEFKDRAIEYKVSQFRDCVQDKLKQIKADKTGKKVEAGPFAGAKLRSKKEIQTEILRLEKERIHTRKEIDLNKVSAEAQKLAMAYGAATLRWAIACDPISVEIRENEKKQSQEERTLKKELKSQLVGDLKDISHDAKKLAKIRKMIEQVKEE